MKFLQSLFFLMVTLHLHGKSNSHKSGASESNCTSCTSIDSVTNMQSRARCFHLPFTASLPLYMALLREKWRKMRKVDIYYCLQCSKISVRHLPVFYICATVPCATLLGHALSALLPQWRKKGGSIVLWKNML